jgi:transposase
LAARRELAQEAQARVIRGLDGHPESPLEEWPPEGSLSFLPSTATAAEQWSRAVAARERGHRGGRRPKLSAAQQRQAQRLKLHGMPITEIAQTLGCSRHTVYKALDQARVEAE